MGQAQAREFQAYVVPNSATPGSSPIYRSKLAANGFITNYDKDVLTLYDNFRKGLSINPDGRCLGTRALKPDGTRGDYEWLTYSQVAKRVDNFASGLVNLGLKPGSHVGIYSINRAEWIITELASYTQSMVVVSLYDTLGPDAVSFILNQAEIPLVVCSKDKVSKLLELVPQCPSLKIIVQMEREGDAALQQQAEAKQVRLLSMAEVEDSGAWKPIPHQPPKPSDLATIMYTSGTTGLPKGVMLTHANCVAEVTSARMHGVELTKDDVYISYLPLAHIFERVVSAIVLSYGAAGGFYQGDVLKLFDDIQLLRPTLFPSVPRLFNRLFDKVNSTIATTGGLKKFLYEWGYATKKSQLDYGQDPANRFWDSLVFSNLRAKLGGRVRYIITGSAPISEQVFQFLQICFGCPVLQGYGLTETTAACNISAINDWKCGHVGPPTVSVEEKLEDVPEMNYFTANPRGPPQGEICVRGPSVFVGYYKDEEKTREAIDKDGWFHTGDIGQWNPDGTLTIIDRKKNIFKLAQGEYVAAEYLEQVYVKAPLVAQIFVYGDSLQAVLVAVVVPDAEVLLPWARSQGLKGDLEALCREEAVRKAVLAELTQVGKDAKLKGFEFVKAIHLDHRPFSVENGLLTPTFKNKRADLKKHYQAEIDAMYAALKAAEKKE